MPTKTANPLAMPEEHWQKLKKFYVEQAVPVDQLVINIKERRKMTAQFNAANNTTYTHNAISTTLLALRRRSILPPLGQRAAKACSDNSPTRVKVKTPHQDIIDIFHAVYKENDYPSDRMENDLTALTGFTREINRRTGIEYTNAEISTILYRLRKTPKLYGILPHCGKSFTGPKFRSAS